MPGLAASKHYRVRVRSVGGGWQNAFAWETACKTIEEKTDAYFDTLEGWMHTRVNFEIAGAVEVEITRAKRSSSEPARCLHPRSHSKR